MDMGYPVVPPPAAVPVYAAPPVFVDPQMVQAAAYRASIQQHHYNMQIAAIRQASLVDKFVGGVKYYVKRHYNA